MSDAETSEDDERLEQDLPSLPGVVSHPAPQWVVDFRQGGKGFTIALGDHALVFADRGKDHLLISFDNLSSARDDAMDRDPWGYGFAAKCGWSQLGVMAFKPSWFRDEALFDEMRRLARRGFFRRFKSVTLTGTSMGGYAACAFASLIPGCQVIAFSPQSTLSKALVPWEERFAAGRKADWSGDFADGAVESAAAARVWLVYDPHFPLDVAHVERFTHDRVIRLPARYSGHKTALFLRRAEILSAVMRQAVAGELTAASFFQLYRKGRALPWYTHAVGDRLIAKNDARLLRKLVPILRTAGQPPAVYRGIHERAAVAGLLDRRPLHLQASRNPGRRLISLPADPVHVADLYMSSPDLPPPVDAPPAIWQHQRRAEANIPDQPLPWQNRRSAG